MITLVLHAGDIPDYTKVRKPTGEKPYVLRQRLPVYGIGAITGLPDKEINCDPNIVFIVSDTGVNAILKDTKLAMDLELNEAINFLQRIKEDKRVHQ